MDTDTMGVRAWARWGVKGRQGHICNTLMSKEKKRKRRKTLQSLNTEVFLMNWTTGGAAPPIVPGCLLDVRRPGGRTPNQNPLLSSVAWQPASLPVGQGFIKTLLKRFELCLWFFIQFEQSRWNPINANYAWRTKRGRSGHHPEPFLLTLGKAVHLWILVIKFLDEDGKGNSMWRQQFLKSTLRRFLSLLQIKSCLLSICQIHSIKTISAMLLWVFFSFFLNLFTSSPSPAVPLCSDGCRSVPCLWVCFYFVCQFILFIRFYILVRSYGISKWFWCSNFSSLIPV